MFLTGLLLLLSGCNDKPDELPDYTYTGRITGDTSDINTNTSSGTCLMGGSTDVDEAFKWMINKSGGGDFVVIRFDVSFGYNNYIYRMKGINSVETIVISGSADAINPVIANRIRNAEALFIAGGDQARYVRLWRNSPIEDAVNYLINTKHAPVGGTSAGCAILGSSYFAALNGSVTSEEALRNPYNSLISLGHDDFINNPVLQNTITDQHFSQRERIGRLVCFMARIKKDQNKNPKAIAVDEETAVCVDENGIACVFGSNNAFFLKASEDGPETCLADTSLTWDRGNKAISVYRVTGSSSGNGSINLNNYEIVSGGKRFKCFVQNGVLYKSPEE